MMHDQDKISLVQFFGFMCVASLMFPNIAAASSMTQTTPCTFNGTGNRSLMSISPGNTTADANSEPV